MESSLPSPQIHTTNNEDEHKVNVRECKDIISTFPRKCGWIKSRDIYQYEGFWYIEAFLQGIMSVQQHFLARSTDIIVATPPKTGTTWLKALTFAIVTRKGFDDSSNPLLVKVPHACFPFLEFDLTDEKSYIRDPEIPLVSTHLPYTSLPNSIIQEDCKIIYIWRDAKDTFVSNWHYSINTIKSFGVEADQMVSMEEAFEQFCQGFSLYGPYWDHVLSYWKVKLENPNKILFLKYEEMMKDTAVYVKKLAEFMGYPFTTEEEENGVLQKVVDMCSFDKLSNLEVNKSGIYKLNSLPIEAKAYFRKAKVGDWSNHLTAEMGARLDSIMESKLKDSGLMI